MFVFIIAMFLVSSPTYAQTISTTSPAQDTQTIIKHLQEQIKVLETQIVQLKTQLELTNQQVTAIQIELKINRSLQRGITGDDVKGLQIFLSQFPSIYPEGLVTGYFGALTESAVKKWQAQQGIESIGIVGPKTTARINEIIEHGAGQSGVVPPGLIKAPGVQSTIQIPTIVSPVVSPVGVVTVVTPASTQSLTTGQISAPSAPTTVTTPNTTNTATTNTTTATTSTTPTATTTTVVTTVNTAAPVISNIQVTNITANTAVITWTTDKPADSRVYYSWSSALTEGNRAGEVTSLDSTLVTSHSIKIPGLVNGGLTSAANVYYFQVMSRDSSGNLSRSDSDQSYASQSFTTSGTLSSSPGNSSMTVQQISAPSYSYPLYGLSLADPDGINTFVIGVAGGGTIAFGGQPTGCPTSLSTDAFHTYGAGWSGGFQISSSDFPLQGWIIDCADSYTKYSVQASLSSSPATLSITSTPDGATATNINSGYVYCESTPCNVQVTVPPNSVNIKVSKIGYYDWTNLIYLYSGQTTNVNATLLATATSTSSFNIRAKNLAAVSQAIASISAILEKLLNLLRSY